MLVFVWVANFPSSFSRWHFLANFFDYGRTILTRDVKWYFNLNFSTNFFWIIVANIISDCAKRRNTFFTRYSCAMRNFNVVRYFDGYFVTIAFNLNLAGWSTSKKWKRVIVAFSFPRLILWFSLTFIKPFTEAVWTCSSFYCNGGCGKYWITNNWMTYYCWWMTYYSWWMTYYCWWMTYYSRSLVLPDNLTLLADLSWKYMKTN